MSKEIKKEKVKKVFLDELPRRIYHGRDCIEWIDSMGYKIRFIYDDISGEIEIISYNRDKQCLDIKYNDKIFNIYTGDLTKCKLGNILGKRTNKFKIEIGQVFKDDKRDIIIIDRKYREDKAGRSWKVYKYKCNKCGFKGGEHYKNQIQESELWVEESMMLNGIGCACCCNSPIIVVEGINDIPTTAPFMSKWFQGGIEESKKYSLGCGVKLHFICPECGRVRKQSIPINELYRRMGFKCQCGNEGISYCEKYLFNVFEQLKIEFITQLSKSKFSWCDNYRYDFYLNGHNIIIETHGLQHYKESTGIFLKTLKQEQSNDEYKKQLALSNSIKEENYIVIDCRKSDSNWIKKNILSSNLSNMFDLSIINWDKVNEFACSSMVKLACEHWNNGIHSTKEIANIMKVDQKTIVIYLKQGNGLWCDYDPKEELRKSAIKNGKLKFRPVICLDNGKSFESAMDCVRQSENVFGIKLNNSKICVVCKGERPHHHQFHFKYIQDLSPEERIKYKIDELKITQSA